VPHVVHVRATAPERADYQYFGFPAWVEICRQRTGIAIPDDLREPYFDALAQLPALAAAAASRPWDEAMVQSALGAIAVTKGSADVAEAASELTVEVAREFLDWLAER
jgi:hypothetical protein